MNSTGNGMVQGKEAENFTDCSPEYIRSFYLNNTMNYVEWITRIDVPKSTDVCPFPCDYWEHSISVMKNAESFEVAKPSSLVKVTRANMNPHVSEVEKLGWQDYLCLVGGAMGMWTGSSVVTILQVAAGNLALLLALLYKTNFYQRKNLASTTEVTLKIEQMLFHVEDQEQIGPNPEVGKDEEEVK